MECEAHRLGFTTLGCGGGIPPPSLRVLTALEIRDAPDLIRLLVFFDNFGLEFLFSSVTEDELKIIHAQVRGEAFIS